MARKGRFRLLLGELGEISNPFVKFSLFSLPLLLQSVDYCFCLSLDLLYHRFWLLQLDVFNFKLIL